MRIYKRFNVTSSDPRDGGTDDASPLRGQAAVSAGTEASCLSEALENALEFIRASLEGMSLSTKEANRAQLMAEEALVRLVEQGDFEKGGVIQVSIRRFLGRVTINLTVPGREFDFAGSLELGVPLDEEDMSPDTAAAIQNILLRSFEDSLKYRHRFGYNRISVTAVRSPLASLYWTLGALLIAVAAGLLLKAFASPTLCDALNGKVFVPVRTVFMNGLKMCSAPFVFFAIASCIAQFGGLSEMKRIGARLLVCFVVTQAIASVVGIGIFFLFPRSGRVTEIAASAVSRSASTLTGTGFSVENALGNLMPSNIIRPFLNGDMLQLIILAAFVGVAVGMLGAGTVRNFLEESRGVFVKITVTLMRFIPLIVFCSITSMFLTTGFSVLFSLLGLLFMVIAGDVALIAVYYLITTFWCRLNPARLVSKSLPMIITAFSTGSCANATLPDSMRTAAKLGISPKVYSLSIPLGSSIDKNAACMFIVTVSLFLADIYGLNVLAEVYGSDVPPSLMLSIALSGVALAMGVASVPGFGILSLSLLLSQLGVPIEAVGLVMGIFPVFDMFGTAVNCMGDMTATLVAASSAGMLDLKVYNNRSVKDGK